MEIKQINIKRFRAAILDMDGVVTRTAIVHAKAWKKMFDEFLLRHSEKNEMPFQEFDIDRDYTRYVDGLPRLDGIRQFLASRNIAIPVGRKNDPEDSDTVAGLARRKNRLFNDVLDRDGVEVYQDTISKIQEWRQAGLRTAIVSSSRNCQKIIEKAGIVDLFDARVDGMVSEEMALRGKPAPDIFLEACARVAVPPSEAVVFEDAISGVQAGQAGGFGLVVGVARKKNHAELKQNGADVTIEDLRLLG